MSRTEISEARVEALKAGHRVLAECHYDPPQVDKGYADQTLKVNVSDNSIITKPVDEEMKRKFIGGRGFDLWLLWDAVTGDTRWDSPLGASPNILAPANPLPFLSRLSPEP
jgi:hypothetical protein